MVSIMYNTIVISMVEMNVLAQEAGIMAFEIYDGCVHGLGTVRVQPGNFGSAELKKVAEELLNEERTAPFIYGPIRVYGRGPKDLRLEYTFKVSGSDPRLQSDRLLKHVRETMLRLFKIQGQWNHNHWLGIEIVVKR